MSADKPELLLREHFTGLSDATFELVSEELPGFAFEHVKTRGLGGESDAREPFSVIFLGPLEPILAQSMYRLRHSELGELDLFLVPVGPDRDNSGIQYEAIFS